MVPVDAKDICKEYEILLNELSQYNPELLDKSRILAVTKADLADDEILGELKKDLPDLPVVFISSHQQTGLEKLKQMLWKELTRDA